MKKALLTMALVLMAVSAHAKTGRYYVIDMTGKHFVDDNFNQMGDDVDASDKDGYAIKLDGQYGVDYTIESKASEEGFGCVATPVKQTARQSLVMLESGVDTDSGQTCEYLIQYQDGRHATLTVYEEGT